MAFQLAVTVFLLLFVPIALYVHFRLVGSKYWERRKVPHLKPVFFLGNMWKSNILENFMEILSRYHLENKEKKMVGYWFLTTPNLLVTDLDIVKRVLIRDFNHFRDRGMEMDLESEPLAGHLFSLSGKRWRNLRVKLTPTFSSGKMKMMFSTVAKCGAQLRDYLQKPAEDGEVIEVKDLMARFGTDVIASCAFGIEVNSLQNPDTKFRHYGKEVNRPTFRNVVVSLIALNFPRLFQKLKIRLLPKEISDFFVNTVKETVEYRERTNTRRNDFLQLIMQIMKTGKLEDVDKTETPEDGTEYPFTLNDAAAQCFLFFSGGFETSSTALQFTLYELAVNPDIQKRLQDEVDSAMSDCSGEVTYERLQRMEYLDMVVQETLRKYPPLGNLQRQCIKEYYIPEYDTTLEKGLVLNISILGIHRDPDIYPEPDRFDPERFSAEEKAKRHACAFLPFGEGPRNCIGNRFGLMQIKTALFYILSAYDVVVTKTTPIPMKLKVSSFIPTPVGGMNLVFRKRQNN